METHQINILLRPACWRPEAEGCFAFVFFPECSKDRRLSGVLITIGHSSENSPSSCNPVGRGDLARLPAWFGFQSCLPSVDARQTGCNFPFVTDSPQGKLTIVKSNEMSVSGSDTNMEGNGLALRITDVIILNSTKSPTPFLKQIVTRTAWSFS